MDQTKSSPFLGKRVILIQPWVCALKSLIYLMETTISVDTYQDIDLKSSYVRSEVDHQWRPFTQQGWSRKHTNFLNPFCPLGIKTRSANCITCRSGTWKSLSNFYPHETLASVDK